MSPPPSYEGPVALAPSISECPLAPSLPAGPGSSPPTPKSVIRPIPEPSPFLSSSSPSPPSSPSPWLRTYRLPARINRFYHRADHGQQSQRFEGSPWLSGGHHSA